MGTNSVNREPRQRTVSSKDIGSVRNYGLSSAVDQGAQNMTESIPRCQLDASIVVIDCNSALSAAATATNRLTSGLSPLPVPRHSRPYSHFLFWSHSSALALIVRFIER